MNIIDDFRKEEYRFLMNSYESDIVYGYGEIYPSAEHAYQSAKTSDLSLKEQIRSCSTAREAKRLGQSLQLTDGWDDVRLSVMESILNIKFDRGTELGGKLLATGGAQLISGGDTFWGMVDGVGENNLGKLLMKIRQENHKYVYDSFNRLKEYFLVCTGWSRCQDGDVLFNKECWVPPWDKSCYFDVESAVLNQGKLTLEALKDG